MDSCSQQQRTQVAAELDGLFWALSGAALTPRWPGFSSGSTISLFFKWKSRGTERFSILPVISQLESDCPAPVLNLIYLLFLGVWKNFANCRTQSAPKALLFLLFVSQREGVAVGTCLCELPLPSSSWVPSMQPGCSECVSEYACICACARVHASVHAGLCEPALPLPLPPPAFAAAATSDEGKPALCPHHEVHHFSSWVPVTSPREARVTGA